MTPMHPRHVFAAVLGLGMTGLGCSDPLPTEQAKPFGAVQFNLSAASATAFDEALSELTHRTSHRLGQLTPLLVQLNDAIAAREPTALRRAVSRTEDVLNTLRADESNAEIAIELELIRLILEHARALGTPERGDDSR